MVLDTVLYLVMQDFFASLVTDVGFVVPNIRPRVTPRRLRLEAALFPEQALRSRRDSVHAVLIMLVDAVLFVDRLRHSCPPPGTSFALLINFQPTSTGLPLDFHWTSTALTQV